MVAVRAAAAGQAGPRSILLRNYSPLSGFLPPRGRGSYLMRTTSQTGRADRSAGSGPGAPQNVPPGQTASTVRWPRGTKQGGEPAARPVPADVPTNPGARAMTSLVFRSPRTRARWTEAVFFVLSDPPVALRRRAPRRHSGVTRAAVGRCACTFGTVISSQGTSTTPFQDRARNECRPARGNLTCLLSALLTTVITIFRATCSR